MQRLTLGGGIPDQLTGSIVALGNFDGFHLGHQAVVEPSGRSALSRTAAGDRRDLRPASGAPVQARSAALPPDHARPAREPVRPRRRRRDAGVRVRPASSRRCTPRISSPRLLGERIGAAGVVTGDDFTFGKGAPGDVAHAQGPGRAPRHRRRSGAAGAARGRAHLVRPHPRGSDRRRHRHRDPHAQPRPMRSRAWSSTATQRGRELGYPTANLSSAITSGRSTASTRCA